MRGRFSEKYNNSSLETRIRIMFLVLLLPIFLYVVVCFFNLWSLGNKYDVMINAAANASGFNLDFKKDFDYETYLLIVGNKTPENSGIWQLLADARQIVVRLKRMTESRDNLERLDSISRYLDNLETYTGRIVDNLYLGSRYDDNISIWENDVQIVTSLVEESVTEYLYYEMQYVEHLREDYRTFFLNMVKISAAALVIIVATAVFISLYMASSITRPIARLGELTDLVAGGDFGVRAEMAGGPETRKLAKSFNDMITEIDDLLSQVKKEQILLRKAEFELLQAQINPHFLYNTLDAIVWLAESGRQQEVVRMVGSLSDFFRTALNQGRDIISVREEMIHVRSYLEIEQVRYQDILSYAIEVPEELLENFIPKITVQPLVENALYHGIKNRRGGGLIKISGERRENGFVISVSDDGIGVSEDRLKQIRDKIDRISESDSAIFGLYNVNERIRLNFGDDYGISMESVYNEGTKVDIFLPYAKNNQPES